MWPASISRTVRATRNASASRWYAARPRLPAAMSDYWAISRDPRSASRASAKARSSWPRALRSRSTPNSIPWPAISSRSAAPIRTCPMTCARATRCCCPTGRSCWRSRKWSARASHAWCARAGSFRIAKVSIGRGAASRHRPWPRRISMTCNWRPSSAWTTSPSRSRAMPMTYVGHSRSCANGVARRG